MSVLYVNTNCHICNMYEYQEEALRTVGSQSFFGVQMRLYE